MGEWKPLITFFIILFTLGIIITYLIIPLIPTQNLELTGGMLSLYNFISGGITVSIPLLPDFTINPFPFLSSDTLSRIHDDMVSFSLIPSFLLIPLIIILSLMFIFGAYKALSPT